VSRRVRTLLVGGVLFVVLFILALTLPVPYVVLSPGPTYDTLGSDNEGNQIIVIKGTETKNTTGHLNMTTVGISNRPLTAFAALDGWLLHDEVVVPKSSIYPPGQSRDQVDKQNTQDFAESQDDAIAAASCELGYPSKFGVIVVQADSPAQKHLEPADILLTLDGTPVDSAAKLTAVLETQSPGKEVSLEVTRAGKPMTVSVTLGQPNPGKKGARIGIEVGPVCAAPFTVDLGLGNQIGGPSAGLMFALGIMDKVGSVDLTKGAFIAGTGTISAGGEVGAIGGIQLKMIAAHEAGATVFLAPAGNCPDVTGATPKGLNVIKIDTLHHAVEDLIAIQSGKSVPHC
jgi:PDZ domain-containing protein